MIDDGIDALELALALHAAPDRARAMRDRSLPSQVSALIRIAAGDEDAIERAMTRASASRRVVIDAAVLFIQQVLFHEGADSYRLLGVRADASGEAIKEQYRWLMRWLHPDRHPERWEVVYSERVNRAWNSLNSEQKRQDYDASVSRGAASSGSQEQAGSIRHSTRPIRQRSRRRASLSPRALRRLPVLVLGGLATVAAISVAVLYRFDRDQRLEAMEVSVRNGSEGSAQEEAIRRRIAFDEHVIELSQPILPSAPRKTINPMPAVAPIAAMPAAVARTASALRAPPEEASQQLSTVARIGGPVAEAKAAVVVPSPVVADLRIHPASAAATLRSSSGPGTAALALPRTMPAPERAASPAITDPERAVAQASAAANSRPLAAASGTSGGISRDEENLQPAVRATNPLAAREASILVVQEFEEAYARGDLPQMMRLFTVNAVNNRGGIRAISEDYDQLFHNSSVHLLRLEGVKWNLLSDRIVGTGGFDAHIRSLGEQQTREVHGWIRIEAVPVDGVWKIQSIQHGNAE